MSEYLDPDDVIKANHTPPLRKVLPVYTSEDTPPPFVTEESSSSSGSAGSEVAARGDRAVSGKNSRRRRTRPSQCDTVLIGQLEPNRPDIAVHAGNHALESASQSEAEEEEEDRKDPMVGVRNDGSVVNHVSAADMAMATKATEALKRVTKSDIEMADTPESMANREDGSDEDMAVQSPLPGLARQTSMQQSSPLPNTRFDVRPPPRPIPPPISTMLLSPQHRPADDDDSIATSPALAKYAIIPAFPNPADTLPAMQKSPPRSSSGQSPESHQTLPSLKTALSQVSDGSGNGISHYSSATSQSPSMTRPSPSHIQPFGPSPASYAQSSPNMSPPGLPTHPGFWRSTPREGSHSTSTPSEYQSQSQSTPSSAITHPSPMNAYPTPSIQDHKGSVNGTSATQPVNGDSTGANGPLASNSFKCTYPGCNALPFQTQYLLNSHANVHSSSRPHFCPVESCPRGPGGKGFKRKNEMIRHGLVHESPGYQCPFCPDQTHKYPRPDNLQRHVRVHHVDKDRDDPLLREVLAQRPEGGNRGRRRRI